MTKKELEKEAEEYAKENYCDEVRATARNAYLDCARLKEKRIAELEKENEIFKKANEIIAQQRDDRDKDIIKFEERNVELIDKVMELKSQIEKMKCCGNCTKGNCVNIGQTGKACAYWTSNKLRR